MNKEIERLRILGIILERRFRTGLPPIYLIGRGDGKSWTRLNRFYSEINGEFVVIDEKGNPVEEGIEKVIEVMGRLQEENKK